MELIAGFLVGALVGVLLALNDLKVNRKRLFSHFPDLPFLLLLYLAAAVWSVATGAPQLLRFVVSGMAGVESGMMLTAKRFRKGSD